MVEALEMIQGLWNANEVSRIIPRVNVIPRVCELIELFRLGRKRILDTALAATLEAAGLTALASLNPRDYAVFPFLDVVDPSNA